MSSTFGEIFRGVIQYHGESEELLAANFKKLLAANVRWVHPADQRIYELVARCYEELGVPSDETLFKMLEDDKGLSNVDRIETKERIGDFEASKLESGTNYAWGITACVNGQTNGHASRVIKKLGDILKKNEARDNREDILAGAELLRGVVSSQIGEVAVATSIQITADTHLTVKKAVEALSLDPDIYARGGFLVRVLAADDPRKTSTIELVKTSVLTKVHLSRSATWEKVSGKEWIQVQPPRDIGQAVNELQRWEGIRLIRGVTNVPLMRADGSILCDPGYDTETGLFHEPGVELLPVPERPSFMECLDASAYLLELLSDFSIVGSGRATWMSGVFTFFGREMFEGPSPAHIFNSNVRGAGKGLLIKLLGWICLGDSVPVGNYTPDEAELRKRITSMLMPGRGLVLFDDINPELEFGNSTLNALLTADTWNDRELGTNNDLSLPNRAVWLASGVRVTIKGDCTRRVIHCRLENLLEKPETRDPQTFIHPDLRAYVLENRAKLIQAVLTILRGWVVAGRPPPKKSLGSYEGWAATICGAIEWIGLPSPIKTQGEYDALSGESGDAGVLKPLLLGLKELWGLGGKHYVAEILSAIAKEDDRSERHAKLAGCDGYSEEEAGHQLQSLRDAVLEIAPVKGRGLPTARYLGKKLGKALRRTVGGLRLNGQLDRNSTMMWCVEEVDRPTNAGSCGVTAGREMDSLPAPPVPGSSKKDPNAGSAGRDLPTLRRSAENIDSATLESIFTGQLLDENCDCKEGSVFEPAEPAFDDPSEDPASGTAGGTFNSLPAAEPAEPAPNDRPRTLENNMNHTGYPIKAKSNPVIVTVHLRADTGAEFSWWLSRTNDPTEELARLGFDRVPQPLEELDPSHPVLCSWTGNTEPLGRSMAINLHTT